MILFDIQNSFFNLEGQFVCVSVGCSSSIFESFNTDAFVSVIDLVACFARDSKLTTNSRHFLAVKKSCH